MNSARLTITCATCKATLDLYYNHADLSRKDLSTYISDDATMSSDWHWREGSYYCDDCWNAQENTREEQAMQARAEDNGQWEKLTDAAQVCSTASSPGRGRPCK